MRGPTCANPPVRGRQCHVDALQGPAQAQGLGLRHRQAINDAQSATLWLAASESSCTRCCATGPSSNRPSPRNRQDRCCFLFPRGATPREGADDGADCVARGQPLADGDFNLASPSLPHQVPNEHAENTVTRKRSTPGGASALDLSENAIRSTPAVRNATSVYLEHSD